MSYTVLKSHATPAASMTRAGAVILVDRDTSFQPYVTAWRGDGDNSWCWGHYFNDLDEATADYDARCIRGY
jgi:hypothetical protein